MVNTGKIRSTVMATVAAAAFAAFVLSGCQYMGAGNSGTVSLSLTDAPITSSTVSGVYITIDSVQADVNGTWQTFLDFSSSPKKLNLLNFSSGISDLLGKAPLPSGTITQLRFMLGIPNLGSSSSNPGCYLTFNDGSSDQPLFAPSAGQTGYKTVGSFDVPVNGTVDITADFNVSKMVVQTGNGSYILKPTLRIVVDNQAGTIKGTVSDSAATLASLGSKIVVYAYTSGSYTANETSGTTTSPPFSGAVEGAAVDLSTGAYTLGYLAAGDYTLVVAAFDANGNLVGSAPLYVGSSTVSVKATATTSANLSL